MSWHPCFLLDCFSFSHRLRALYKPRTAGTFLWCVWQIRFFPFCCSLWTLLMDFFFFLAEVLHFHRVTFGDLFIYDVWAAPWLESRPSPCQRVEGKGLLWVAGPLRNGLCPWVRPHHPSGTGRCQPLRRFSTRDLVLCSTNSASPFKADFRMRPAFLLP